MFVPCDKDGNVLKEIYGDELFEMLLLSNLTEEQINEEYQQAKERCLFDGYVFIHNGKYSTLIAKNLEGSGQINIMEGIIEDLVKYNLELTETAIKQIEV